MKRSIPIAVVIALLVTSVMASVASAEMNKFTFNDVALPDGTVGEIEASSKSVKKGSFTTCNYYSDDYGTYLGYYTEDGFASADATEVKQFCLDNFENREHS